jgi:hypothetical protein
MKGSPPEIFQGDLAPPEVVSEEGRGDKEETGDADGQQGMWSVSGTDACRDGCGSCSLSDREREVGWSQVYHRWVCDLERLERMAAWGGKDDWLRGEDRCSPPSTKHQFTIHPFIHSSTRDLGMARRAFWSLLVPAIDVSHIQ